MNNRNLLDDSEQPSPRRVIGGMLIGLAAGIALGIALDSLPIGIAIGSGLGVSLAASFNQGQHREVDSNNGGNRTLLLAVIIGFALLVIAGLVLALVLLR